MRWVAACSLLLLVVPSPSVSQETATEPEVVVPEGRGELEAAVADLVERSVEAVRADPESATAWSRLCMAYEANLLWPEAERCYERLTELADAEPVWRLHLAVALIETGSADRARQVLEDLVAQAPDLAAARERLGVVCLELGDLDAARRAFQHLTETLPQSAAGYLGLGEVALESGDPERAVRALEKALELDPQRGSAHYLLGLAYRGLGRTEDARRELALGAGTERRYLPSPKAEEVARYSAHLTARIETAGRLLQENRFDEALGVLEDLAARHPENLTVLNDLAVAHLRRGELDEAHEVLERALAADEESFSTYLNLSAWASYSQRPLEALAMARKAVALAPDVAATRLALARALGDPQALASASDPAAQRKQMRVELEAAIALGVDTPDAYLQLARESWQEGDAEAALGALDDARRRWPDFWPGDLMQAWILVRSGREEEARPFVDRVREVAPDHPDLVRLEALLESGGADDSP